MCLCPCIVYDFCRHPLGRYFVFSSSFSPQVLFFSDAGTVFVVFISLSGRGPPDLTGVPS
eukprot:NODE_6078_length_655_cov_2.293729_g5153_i0.p4 GENE.NODE_6078_length_655_cov_2.293729_g5153_i0~~NODE_6078_length_655_cov_2.293729_g5153_i0.p4  ORF type:complete len:60 (-),score=4.31 NODE_6078_length_655_cov_2.293729_g5153_i0:26-205(-)